MHDIRHGINRAIGFLEERQLPNGEFWIWAATDIELTENLRLDSSPSVAAFVLYALRLVDDPRADGIRRRAVDFLIGEMRGMGLWSYWTKGLQRTIAPDVDDTAWVSFVLRDHHPLIRFGLNTRVMMANRDERGRFRSFFRRPGEPNDVDSVVNANALFFLGERPGTAAAIQFVADTILCGQEDGSYAYYADHLALYYAASRAVFAGVGGLAVVRDVVIERVMARRREDGSFGDALATAFAVCTLLNLDWGDLDAIGPAIAWLLDTQDEAGGWPAAAVFAGPEPPAPPSIWWGSAEFTTALCLEALARCPA